MNLLTGVCAPSLSLGAPPSASINQRSAAQGASSYSDVADAIRQAQQESAAINKTKEETEALNAPSAAGLMHAGLSVTTMHMSDPYRDRLLKSVDQDNDGTVSETELMLGMGEESSSLEKARKVYQAMDINGDGILSGQEFKDSLPNPLSTEQGRQALSKMKEDMIAGRPVDANYLTDQFANLFPLHRLLGEFGDSLTAAVNSTPVAGA